MTNLEKYDNCFKEVFKIDQDKLTDELKYQSIETWDSVGHMMLMSMLETEFDIMLETEDILVFESYPKGKQILTEKYDVEF